MTETYRNCVGVFLLNQKKQVFIAKRCTDINNISDNFWQLPQGGIDEGEEFQTSALRELFEETSIQNVSIVKSLDYWLYYDFPEEFKKSYNYKYKGQRQRWFLMQFLDKDDLNINLNTKHKEFDVYRWEDPKNIVDLTIDFKKEVYKKVLKEFLPYITSF